MRAHSCKKNQKDEKGVADGGIVWHGMPRANSFQLHSWQDPHLMAQAGFEKWPKHLPKDHSEAVK